MKWPKNNIYLAILFVAGLIILWQLRSVVLLLFGSLMIGIIGHGASEYLSRRFKIRYGYGVIVFFLLIFGMLGLLVLVTMPTFSSQFQNFISQFPSELKQAEDTLSDMVGIPFNLSENLEGLDIISLLRNYFPTLFSLLSGALAMFIIGLYLIINPATYRHSLYYIFGKERIMPMVLKADHDLQRWFLAQLASMIIVATLTTTGLLILGVPFAFVLGFIAGVLEFIPTLGSYIAFIPAFIVAISQGPNIALYVLILYVVIQFLEGNFITPFIQQRASLVPAAIQLGVQLIFGVLFGLLGILFAVPFYVFVRAIYGGLKSDNKEETAQWLDLSDKR